MVDEGYLQAQILHLSAAAESSGQYEEAHDFYILLSRRSAQGEMRLSRYRRSSTVTGVCVTNYSDHLEVSLSCVLCNAMSHNIQESYELALFSLSRIIKFNKESMDEKRKGELTADLGREFVHH